jgi:hypothetical protein
MHVLPFLPAHLVWFNHTIPKLFGCWMLAGNRQTENNDGPILLGIYNDMGTNEFVDLIFYVALDTGQTS